MEPNCVKSNVAAIKYHRIASESRKQHETIDFTEENEIKSNRLCYVEQKSCKYHRKAAECTKRQETTDFSKQMK